MQEHSYPDLENHKVVHKELLSKVGEFVAKFNSGDLGISIKLCDFLQNWLKVHICGIDKKYGQHINAQSVSAT